MEIMLGGCNEDNERGVELQRIVDGLTKPRDVQIEMAPNLLEKKGKTAKERVNGLANLVSNHKSTGSVFIFREDMAFFADADLLVPLLEPFFLFGSWASLRRLHLT